MADFYIAYLPTARNEGGYSNTVGDTGGQTVFGLTRRDWPNWSGWKRVDQYVANHQIAELNADAELKASVAQLFKANYWDVIKGDLINDQQIANQAFDTAINMGTGTAARFLQSIAKVTVDLNVGPATISAVNAMDAATLYSQFIAMRKARYEAIIADNPSQAKFKASWFSRMPLYKS